MGVSRAWWWAGWMVTCAVGCARWSSGDGPGPGPEDSAAANPVDSGDPHDPDDTGTVVPPPECVAPRLEPVSAYSQADLLGKDYPRLDHEHGPGVALGDVDGDGWVDALLASPVEQSFGFVNDGAGGLVRTTAFTVDGGSLPTGNAVAMADLDGDGDLDAVLSRAEGQQDLLLWNDGSGAFASEGLVGSTGESLTVSFADVNLDGRLDIFVSGSRALDEEVDLDQPGTGSMLWLGEGGGSFRDGSAGLDAEQRYALTHHGAFLDFELDGDPDLYLSNEYVIGDIQSYLLLNDGAGTFTKIDAGAICTTRVAGMGAAVGDLNNDGWPDIYESNWGRNALLVNNNGVFCIESAEAHGAAVGEDGPSEVAWGALQFDVDGDTWLDLPIAYGVVDFERPEGEGYTWSQPDVLLLSQSWKSFVDVAADLGFGDTRVARSVASADLDRDGIDDLVLVGQIYLDAWLVKDGCPPGITLRFDGPPEHREGFGAQVDLAFQGRTIRRWNWPGSTFSQGDPTTMRVRIGDAAAADVVVTLPDGTVRSFPDTPIGTELTVSWD